VNVVFCSSEVYPFAKTGGLGDVCGSLPLALEKLDVNVVVILPGYRCVGQAGHPIEPLEAQISRAVLGSHIPVYFIDRQDYFDREGLYGDQSGDYKDNLERFGYFCAQALNVLEQVGFQPDIVHCHDWQTALIPVLLKEKGQHDPFFGGTKSILTIHNLAFQGLFPREEYAKLQLDERSITARGFDFYGRINLLKAGIENCDGPTTVSSNYAREILTKKYGCGLEGVLKKRQPVTGILNGIDYNLWDPGKDGHIAQPYNQEDAAPAKARNKAQIQKELFLEMRADFPLFGFVGRLTRQKGMGLILPSVRDMISMPAQFVFLGIGDKQYENELKELAVRCPEKVAVRFEFNEPLGHQIYAGSDFFLMPSEFEPCGLSQMIALRYGTIPVAYKTGGLADTVKHYSKWQRSGNGFVFTHYDPKSFIGAVKKALAAYADRETMERLRHNAFTSDFSWERSARQYEELYRCV
jgi:starch synthase